ncbi:MAG: hydrogenase expression/formation protein HypE [Acidobacteriota bacterium]|nr:hydrogenase expression/formation protein HypE [Acidobacteriota bacterium]MDH3530029.1 hydrogenase expression/formation protein HypE [Acidobacteriota bacterium]
MKAKTSFNPVCPIPISEYPNVLLAHGGGGKLMHNLIGDMFVKEFENPLLSAMHDGAVFGVGKERLAFTTDSYVVDPLFFPGGNIGTLAVNGTVNDLAMCGAKPLYLSVGFILEEGFGMENLWRIVQTMKSEAVKAGVQLVTGDTKVVDRGKGDGIFINTAGVGVVEHDLEISPASVQAGDAILLSGDLGRHGIAIMAAREGLEFETEIESDCAPLAPVIMKLIDEGIEIRCLRDLTRGGLASALVEIAEGCGHEINIEENAIAVREDVRGACEILGFDPMYLANEGRFVLFVAETDAEHALEIMNPMLVDSVPSKIGRVSESNSGDVILKSRIGANRIVDMFTGEQLPRIC